MPMNAAHEATTSDPFRVLGLSSEASEEEIRARYLHLVKQFPPERAAERFREIRAAYETARNPLALARSLLNPPADSPQPWAEVIEEQKAIAPPMNVNLILSLGNRDESPAARGNTNTSDS